MADGHYGGGPTGGIRVRGEFGRWRRFPEGVRFYESSHDFIRENRDRSASTANPAGDLGGWDVSNCRLEEPALGKDAHSLWRISVVCREVYAVLRRHPGDRLYTFDGPVWLIDTVPKALNPSVYGEEMRNLTQQIEQIGDEPDSLLRAVPLIKSLFALFHEAPAGHDRLFGFDDEQDEEDIL